MDRQMAAALDRYLTTPPEENGMYLTTVTVSLYQRDSDVAGTLGDVSWIDNVTCEIITDDLEALLDRLDADDNVLEYSYDD